MIVKPSVAELLTKAKDRYELVIATSKRARQIVTKRAELKKENPSNDNSNKEKEESPVTIAATEIF